MNKEIEGVTNIMMRDIGVNNIVNRELEVVTNIVNKEIDGVTNIMMRQMGLLTL